MPIAMQQDNINLLQKRYISPSSRLVALAGSLLAACGALSCINNASFAQCPQFSTPVATGNVHSPLLTEISGLVASRQSPGILWAHNDSGYPPQIFAMTTDGAHLGYYTWPGASNRDWEDIAIGPGPVPDMDYLYIGDIGDNNAQYPTIVVYRVPEPYVSPDQAPVERTISDVEAIILQYPDGPRDAETLLLDPITHDLYVISKRQWPSRVYRAAWPQSTTELNLMTYVGNLPWGLAVGGDVSPDGKQVIVRGYWNATWFARPEGAPLHAAFSEFACNIPIASEPQGEAIAFDARGCDYFTVSEGAAQPIYHYRRIVTGDLTGDCRVDLADFAAFEECWLSPAVGNCERVDFDGQSIIDLGDLSVWAAHWLFHTN